MSRIFLAMNVRMSFSLFVLQKNDPVGHHGNIWSFNFE